MNMTNRHKRNLDDLKKLNKSKVYIWVTNFYIAPSAWIVREKVYY